MDLLGVVLSATGVVVLVGAAVVWAVKHEKTVAADEAKASAVVATAKADVATAKADVAAVQSVVTKL